MSNTKEIFKRYSNYKKGFLEEDKLMDFDGFNKALGEILSLPVELPVSVLTKLPRCCFLSDAGRRCKKSADFRSNVFLENEIYDKTQWVEINLCKEHFLQLKGKEKLKAR